jgi:DNA-binding MarR family transcriptional regulator
MDKFKDCVIFLLAKAYQKAHGTFKKRLTGYGLTPIQHLILEVLWDEDGLSARTISDRLVLDPATLSGVLERMVSGGWIFKHPDPEDKRILRICLSGKGVSLKSRLTDERDQANQECLDGLTIEEKVLLKRLLRDVSYAK